MKCPRCGRYFKEPPASSRVTGEAICSLCGSDEALDVALKVGIISDVDRCSILKRIREGAIEDE